MKRFASKMLSLAFLLVSGACVSSGTHEAVVKELAKTRADLDETRASLTKERDEVQGKAKTCDENLRMTFERRAKR